MARKITPPHDLAEAVAALEATKLIAFAAFTIAIQSLRGHPTENARKIREDFLALIRTSEVTLPPEEAERFRSYAEATIEELFGRLLVNDSPVNPKSS